MIQRKTFGMTLAVGTVFGLGLLFAGQPAEAAPPAHAKAYGYRNNQAQHRYRPGYGPQQFPGRYGGSQWGGNARTPYGYNARPYGYRTNSLPPRQDVDRDGIRNRNDRDIDGDGVRNKRDDRPANPLVR